jgi:GT2 family glycosyltransferase
MGACVHIVIVNWNTGGYLGQCLQSVALAERPKVTISRVTVVDNASSDGSTRALGDLSLPIELIRNSRNIGFAAACNQAAADSTADYLLFLNPDTRMFPDALGTVMSFMEGEHAADVGICGVRVLDGEGDPTIACARFPTLRVLFGEMTGLHAVLPRLFPRHQLTVGETSRSRVVDQVIGAFFFVRRDLFAFLHGFDERSFLYFEEGSLALRARCQAALSYFLKEVTVLDAGNLSSNQVRATRLYHHLPRLLLFAYRHWSTPKADHASTARHSERFCVLRGQGVSGTAHERPGSHRLADRTPILPATDAAIVARLMAGVRFVAGARYTRRSRLVQAADSLHTGEARVLGVVVNRVPARSRRRRRGAPYIEHHTARTPAARRGFRSAFRPGTSVRQAEIGAHRRRPGRHRALD